MVGEHSWQFRTKNGAVVQNAMPVETSYYYLGAQRVALAISGDPDPERNGLFYIHVDHLGRVSLRALQLPVQSGCFRRSTRLLRRRI